MNNFSIQLPLNKSHCLINARGNYYYVDFTEHTISKISPEFVNMYDIKDIVNLNLSVKELLNSLPDFIEVD
ncbi:hypothetical protein [Ferroplasma acidarmanus]|uniref:hypothetical protein n=1 Tax=Ferroplasma acidarmanus TaxID=97393 RepID=UPI0011D27215|nr:hypothetical protein [Ferroplasma acidarmanus]